MPTSLKRILVTGGAGFLGSHLCDRLVAQGHDIICLDNFFTSQKTNVTHLLGRSNFDLIRHDVTLPAVAAKPAQPILQPKEVTMITPSGEPQAGAGDRPSEPAAGAPRYFEFVQGKSSKFWEISQAGADMTTRWGRIGSAGQSKTKTFADADAAAKQVAKLIAEKTGEGYVEKGAG